MAYEPSRKKIEEECAKIRNQWSKRKKARMARLHGSKGWMPQTISLSDLPDATQQWIISVNNGVEDDAPNSEETGRDRG